jgi:hypothetical protein
VLSFPPAARSWQAVTFDPWACRARAPALQVAMAPQPRSIVPVRPENRRFWTRAPSTLVCEESFALMPHKWESHL